ncbi:hemerythrin domain-containing protein [Micromonospora sp. NPDC051925]|uniref:hemerythrin domain-containing protein n=1 Tax=Micromonospora sp. NPDC051925 TaxID=3364288 RepID=UPI0037CBC884
MTRSTPVSTEHGLVGLPDHVLGFGMMHVAMRRDARRLVHAAANPSPAVADWWDHVRSIIDWHHRSEDAVLWPQLRRLVPGFRAREQRMHGDHRELDRAMAEVSSVLSAWREPDEGIAVGLRFESVLREHLRVEESIVLPIFADELSVAAYLDIERQVLASAPFSVMTLLQSWMSDGADAVTVARMAAGIPPPVRLLGRTVLRRRYQRMVRPVLSAPPS